VEHFHEPQFHFSRFLKIICRQNAVKKIAEINALQLMYTRMGFTNPMATYITTEQGIITLEKLENLEDKAVERLCQVKKPGRTIPNPNAGAPGAPAQIPNPGFNVSISSQGKLEVGRISRLSSVTKGELVALQP
jgi:hypothetical protein